MDAYLLTLLHFNIQYCAGGTAGLIKEAGFPTDDASVQDQTIKESFDPILTMLEGHPSWHFDVELQAYMVEILAERHPESLRRLRALADAGQVELVSFHWSDQLFVAFPWRDQQKSLELTAEVFAANDLPLSDVVFTQEGQFGEGMLDRMPEYGYHIAVLPHNLAEAVWGASSPSALWRYGDDVTVLVGGQGFATADYTVNWHFLNDGELYATDGMNCYLGSAFVEDPVAMEEHAADLQAAEDAGAHIATVGEFVAAHGASATEALPPLVDGTWQPDDTVNLGRWMGGMGLFGADEDELVRTLNSRAGQRLAAAELVPGADADLVDEGWRELLLGEVSDATGWNPLAVEVSYGKDHSSAAYTLAADAIAPACAEGDTHLRVDVASGETTANAVESAFSGEAAAAPFELAFPQRPGTATWTTTAAADVLALDVALEAGETTVDVVFPWDGLVYATIPALTEQVRELPAENVAMNPIGLPMALGLFRVSEGVWVIKDTATTHLAGLYDKSAKTVTFFDETGPPDARTQHYLVVLGDAGRAAAVAVRLNAAPIVDLSCPAGEVTAGPACGCASGPSTPAAALVFVATLLRRRQRKAFLSP